MEHKENKSKTHFIFEGINDFSEILQYAKIGDYIEIITNNQLGWELHEVTSNKGVKGTKLLKTYDDL